MNTRPTPEDLHCAWMRDVVFPAVFVQAEQTNADPTEIAGFMFASLAVILQSKGYTVDQLCAIVKMHSMTRHAASEMPQ